VNESIAAEFGKAVERGDLDGASALLDDFLAGSQAESEAGTSEQGMSLIEHAAIVRRALREGKLDDATGELEKWAIQPPPTHTTGPERMRELPRLNTVGMLLMDFFRHPDAKGHRRYDDMLAKLRKVAQWTRLSSPVPQPGGFFDRAYGELMSRRELEMINRQET
jgi:hypothetical protein